MAPSARTIAQNATKLVGMLAPVGVGLGASKLAAPFLPGFTAWVDSLGAWAPAAFVAGYVVATVAMMPAFLLTIAGGAVFGLVRGAVLVFVGSTVGAVLAFLLGRTILRDWVAKQIAKNPTMVAIDRVVGQEGFKLMILLRLSGIAPFVLTNYAMGVTSVTLRQFVIAMLGMIPTIAVYAAVGEAGAAAPGKATLPPAMLVIGIGCAIVLAVLVTRIVQRALREAQTEQHMQTLSAELPATTHAA